MIILSLRRLLALWLTFAAVVAKSAPAFTAGTTGQLSVHVGFDDDDYQQAADYFSPTGSGAPETASITSFARNSGFVSTQITQVAPYILNGDYWAGTWNMTLAATAGAGGRFGVLVGAHYGGLWNFAIDGFTTQQIAQTTFYYAAKWTSTAYEDLTPEFASTGVGGIGRTLFFPDQNLGAASGAYSGSFKPSDYDGANVSHIGFALNANHNGYFKVNPGNADSSMDFTYSIAFSTTPIDASVFDQQSPATPVPEGGSTIVNLLAAAVLMYGVRTYSRNNPGRSIADA